MSIASEITRIATNIADALTAVENKGVTVPEGSNSDDLPGLIDDIPTGGTPTTGWQPHPDWPDIVSIYNSDVQEGYTKRYIFLVTDSKNTIALAASTLGGTAFKTSDGQFYTADTTHTWDRAYDVACSDGYKTRWVIVYKATEDISVSPGNSIDILYAYFGQCNITGMLFGGTSSSSGNKILQSIIYGDYTTFSISSTQYQFSYCYSLVNFIHPSSATHFYSYMYQYCYARRTSEIPTGTTALESYCLRNNFCVSSLNIPSSVISIASNSFSGMSGLVSFSVYSNFDIAIDLSGSPLLSVSSILAMFANLKDNTGQTAKTLTLGATNLAKLTVAEKAIAINKNWTLA
jgi:hypothetical protein